MSEFAKELIGRFQRLYDRGKEKEKGCECGSDRRG